MSTYENEHTTCAGCGTVATIVHYECDDPFCASCTERLSANQEEYHPVTHCVMTKDGPQALLPTFDPPPVSIDAQTQQLTMF